MQRVCATDVLAILHREADRTGDQRYRIGSPTLRQWVHRGHITRGAGGYDLTEVLAYLERRATQDQRR